MIVRPVTVVHSHEGRYAIVDADNKMLAITRADNGLEIAGEIASFLNGDDFNCSVIPVEHPSGQPLVVVDDCSFCGRWKGNPHRRSCKRPVAP